MDDIAPVAGFLRRLVPLTDAQVRQIHEIVTFQVFARGAEFVSRGAPAISSALVLEGVFAERTSAGDDSITASFSSEGDFVGPIADLLAHRPQATFAIVAVTAARTATVNWARYVELCRATPAWMRFHVTVIERLFLRKAEREHQLLSFTAAERLAWFEARFPTLASRVPLKEVASFLGITPVYLSRLRRKRVLDRRRARTGA